MQVAERYGWKESYTVGNGLIDSQHRTLLELADLLHTAVAAGQGYRIIESAFAALVKYTKEHFYAEEKLWSHGRSERLDAHRWDHDRIVAELYDLRTEGPYGVVFCTPNELSNWVEHRLIRHFVEEDQTAYLELSRPRRKKA